MNKSSIAVIVLALIAVLGYSSMFTLDEREKGIVFRFGEILRSDIEPGLHFKMPVVNNVRKFDARVQTMDSEPELYLTREKKNLVVDSFVKWRVNDVRRYYVTVQGSPAAARARLAQRVNNSLREEFGRRTMQEVVSGDRAVIMDVVRQSIDQEAREIGVEVIDVRLKRVDLDPAISEGVYRRMEAERTRVAKELRARGAEAAERIRADADRQRQIILAEADRESERIRGRGDALATAIYASAFNRDAEFYAMYRSFNAYRNAFQSDSDLMVIEPRSEFFRYFNQSEVAPPATTPTGLSGN